jgi:hypothetical protein
MISDKICPQHLERKAILYVRQSSARSGEIDHSSATILLPNQAARDRTRWYDSMAASAFYARKP